MDLLEKTCTVERLLFIRKLVRSQDKVQYLRCAYCNAKVGRVSDIFTVDGADGANGAYVNPHGVIHQTWTVRQVCDNSVFTVGDAEIQDSWFHGYSWTIAHCANCFSHIGWKFARVSPLQEELDISIEECRPTSFWGISGANIRMFSLEICHFTRCKSFPFYIFYPFELLIGNLLNCNMPINSFYHSPTTFYFESYRENLCLPVLIH